MIQKVIWSLYAIKLAIYADKEEQGMIFRTLPSMYSFSKQIFLK